MAANDKGKAAVCGHCGENASKKCGGCGNMHYCTAECQTADWQYHKLLCKFFADFIHKPAGFTQEVRRAIFLPEKGSKPVFIWLPVESEEQIIFDVLTTGSATASEFDSVPLRDEEDGCVLPATTTGLGALCPPHQRSMITLVCGPFRSGELLDHSIVLFQREDAIDGEPNQCLNRLLGREAASHYRGNMVLAAMTKVQAPAFMLDINTGDLSLALSAMLSSAKLDMRPFEKVTCVKVKVTSSAPFFEEIKVSQSHPAFRPGNLSKVMELVLMPVHTWFYPAISRSDRDNAGPPDSEIEAPFEARCTLTCIDPTSPDFGSTPKSVTSDTRDMLLVGPVHPEFGALDLSVAYYLSEIVGGLKGAVAELTKPMLSPKERLYNLKAKSEMARISMKMRATGMEEAKATLMVKDGMMHMLTPAVKKS